MNYSDRKYRTHINNIIDDSLNYVLNEVNNSQNNNNNQNNNNQSTNNQQNTQSNQNDEQNDFTIVKINPAKSRWRVVTTKNGYQAWCNIKGYYHPIHYDKNLMQNTSDNFVWFDKCSDFLGSNNPYAKGYGGIFRKKEKRHFAVGTIGNRSFKVYADGEYELYNINLNNNQNNTETNTQNNSQFGVPQYDTPVQPNPDDLFFGVYTNTYNKQQFYYRFNNSKQVFIGKNPYSANIPIGIYEIQNNELTIITYQNNSYKTTIPKDINNSNQVYPVTSIDGNKNFGTMYLWYPNNDISNMYPGSLLENKIKNITIQIIKKYKNDK